MNQNNEKELIYTLSVYVRAIQNNGEPIFICIELQDAKNPLPLDDFEDKIFAMCEDAVGKIKDIKEWEIIGKEDYEIAIKIMGKIDEEKYIFE